MTSAIFPVVLGGGLAVPCNPKPAHAGSKGALSSVQRESSRETVMAMKVGSGDDGHREPRQDRKVATVNGLTVSHRVSWLESEPSRPSRWLREGPGTAGIKH